MTSFFFIKRTIDIIAVLFSLPFTLPIFLLTAIFIKLTSKGPVIYWSKRVGRENKIFLMPKLRTMKVDTPQLATHLLNQQDPKTFLTPIGGFLRKSSLDEIPQLYSIFIGDMSLIGPRPALFNQDDLIELRTRSGVHKVRPGVTGYAQVNGRDEISIPEKVKLDSYYVTHMSLSLDFKIFFKTISEVLNVRNISH